MSRKSFKQVETTKKPRMETWYGRAVRFKPDVPVKVVPLVGLNEALTVWVRRKQVSYHGAYLDVVCGRNAALELDVPDPFNEHPVEDWRKLKPITYLPVLVLAGDDELVGRVGYIPVKKQMKDALEGWLTTMADADGGDVTIQDQLVTIVRKGTGQQDTSYQTTVVRPHKYTSPSLEDVDADYNEFYDILVNGLRSQADMLDDLYKASLGGNVQTAPVQAPTNNGGSTPVAVQDDEIDF